MHMGMQADLNACERLQLCDLSTMQQSVAFEASAPAGCAVYGSTMPDNAASGADQAEPAVEEQYAAGEAVAGQIVTKLEALVDVNDKEPAQEESWDPQAPLAKSTLTASCEAAQLMYATAAASSQEGCGEKAATEILEDGVSPADRYFEAPVLQAPSSPVAQEVETQELQPPKEQSKVEEAKRYPPSVPYSSAATIASEGDGSLPDQVKREQRHVSGTPEHAEEQACTFNEDGDLPSVHLLLQLETQYPDAQDHDAMRIDMQGQQSPAEPPSQGEDADHADTPAPSKPADESCKGDGAAEALPQEAAVAKPATSREARAVDENAIWSEILASSEPAADETPVLPRAPSWQPGAASAGAQQARMHLQQNAEAKQRATGTLHLRPVWGSGSTSRIGFAKLSGSGGGPARSPSRASGAPVLAGLPDSPETPSQIQATADVLLMYSRGLPGAASPQSETVSHSGGAAAPQSDAAAGCGAEVQSAPCGSPVPDTYPQLCMPSHALEAAFKPEGPAQAQPANAQLVQEAAGAQIDGHAASRSQVAPIEPVAHIDDEHGKKVSRRLPERPGKGVKELRTAQRHGTDRKSTKCALSYYGPSLDAQCNHCKIYGVLGKC